MQNKGSKIVHTHKTNPGKQCRVLRVKGILFVGTTTLNISARRDSVMVHANGYYNVFTITRI